MTDPKRVLNEFYNVCVEARCHFDLYRSMYENNPTGTQLCVNYAPYFFNDFIRIITRMLVLTSAELPTRHSLAQEPISRQTTYC